MTRKQLLGILLTMLMAVTTRTHAQRSELESLFRDLQTMHAGTQETFDKADSVLDRLVQSSKENVIGVLPLILHAAGDSQLAVRRVAAMALYGISRRPDCQALLSRETPTFSSLLVDPDLPIRRVSMLAIATLRPNASSPVMPFLRTYFAREDAVATIGAAVATVLMEAAPNDPASTNAVVRFMHRSDQSLESQAGLLNGIRYRARSHNPEIAKEVAGYVDSPDEQISVLAIETLQSMGKEAVLDNQRSLSRIAADTGRTPSVRAAARKVLTTEDAPKR